MTSRRAVLVVPALLATLAAPTLPPSADAAPDARVATMAVTEWLPAAQAVAGAAPAGGWRVSAPLPAGDTVLVGAEWGGEPAAVEVRGGRDGHWGQWQALVLDADHDGPDPGSAEQRRQREEVSRPVWVGEVQRLQVRTNRPVEVRLHTVALSDTDHVPPELAAPPGAAHAAAAQPTIVPRVSWDPKGQCAPRSPASYARDVRFSYVHHTASSNSYRASEGPAQVLATCLYHRNSRGWDDVGYNFLVDRYGTAYEGRAGGMGEAVIGAHAAGFNAGSTGVSLIGNFSSSAPPAAMLDTLRRLLAWKLDHHHVDPRGQTVELSGGGSTNRYPSGRTVTLRTVLGHRDTGTTACPGDGMYDYISSGRLAADVAALGAPKLYGGPPARDEQPVIGARPRWDVDLSQASDWRLTIVDAAGTTVRSTGGTAAEEVSLAWDLRDRLGREVPPGTYTATLESPGTTAAPIATRMSVTGSTERQAGADRIATAVALSRWSFDDPRRAAAGMAHSTRVVIASAEAFPDALVATPLAASYEAPILLTGGSRLPPAVAEEIRRLGARIAYVVGGTRRISTGVERDLEAAGIRTVERLAGATRYHTAGKVAWRVVEREGPREALVALGEHPQPSRAFQDALVAGAFGGTFDLPVLLVTPREVTEPTRWVLEQRGWSRGVTLVGGRGIVAAAVKRALGASARASVRELAGDDVYATSAVVAEERLERRAAARRDPHAVDKGIEVVLATGENWPDALAAGAAAARRGAAFLLVHGGDLGRSTAASDWLSAHAAATVHAVAAGGPAAVADTVLARVDAIIRSAGPHTAPPEPWPPDPDAPAGISLPALE